ncbi:MAG: CopD family protein [Gemmatimonadaceae bacterium]|nr:CopD family protein [Gemmatimonadaceae bacterium]
MEPRVFGVESPIFVAIRATLSLSTVALLGILALRWMLLPRYEGPDAPALSAAIARRLPRVLGGIAATALLATLAQLVAQHAAVFGTDAALSRATFVTLLVRADWGRTWWLAFAAASAVGGLAVRLRRPTARAWVAIAVAALALAASQPASGHPAATLHPWRAIIVQTVHLLAGGAWIGTLGALTFVAVPAAVRLPLAPPEHADARVAGLVRAFSPIALGGTAIVAASGLFRAWEGLGSVAALWSSEYGRVLLLKLALLAITLGTGAYNWRRVLPALGEPRASAALHRSARVELAAAVLVLVATAVLVATPMPGE